MVNETMVVYGNHKLLGDNSGSGLVVDEVYLDGQLRKADSINQSDKSFGIFMHSLILSNAAKVLKISDKQFYVLGDASEKALLQYATFMGFDKSFIDSIAPKVNELKIDSGNDEIKASIHLINGQMRVVAKGEPYEMNKRCSLVLKDSKFVQLTRRFIQGVNQTVKEMINRGMQVYSIAIKDIAQNNELDNTDYFSKDMALVALVGISNHQ